MRHQRTDSLGESMLCWDQFYSDNYSWLFATLAKQEEYTSADINNEIEKLFAKLVLHNPELIISSTTAQLKLELSKIYTGQSIFNDDRIGAAQLMNYFYSAN